jgi:uncharacterized SAM-binding protein YcdF (DUF218 family)
MRVGLSAGIGAALIFYAVILTFNESFASYRIVWVLLGIGLIARENRVFPGWVNVLYVLVYGSIILACLILEVKNAQVIQEGKKKEADILLVLGCKYPSRAFTWRAEAAADYMEAHPNAMAVVSGGQGSDEVLSEGEGYRDTLLEYGIEPHRIMTETESGSTRENLENCDRLYDLKNRKVGIVTSSYHLYRSIVIAKQCGYTDVIGIPAKTLLIYEPDNILREVLALIKARLF